MDPGLFHQVIVTGFAKDRAGVQSWAVVSYQWCREPGLLLHIHHYMMPQSLHSEHSEYYYLVHSAIIQLSYLLGEAFKN